MHRLNLLAAGILTALVTVGCSSKSQFSMDAGMGGGGSSQISVYSEAGRPAKHVGKGMANKAVRGFVNLLTGVVEWPMQVYKGYKNGIGVIKNPGLSKTVGVLKGFFFSGPGYWIGRSGSGAVELVTFWAANRQNNDRIGAPLDDEYAWEMGKPYSIFDPTLAEGIKPYGWKFAHGVTDGFLGIVELPAQITKGARKNATGMGIVKGVWYWWSRSATGLGDAVLFLFPNPKDTCGWGWEDNWPWDGFNAK